MDTNRDLQNTGLESLDLFQVFCFPVVSTLGYKNHQSCKILPKFSSTLHFLQESNKFVQESQTLQICYNVEHFLQDSDNVFAKNAIFLVRNSHKKCDVLFGLGPKFQKSSNYQQQQPQLPFTMHKLSQDSSKRVQIVNFEQEDFTCNFTPEITLTYSSYEISGQKLRKLFS